jgi:hypothetical protein
MRKQHALPTKCHNPKLFRIWKTSRVAQGQVETQWVADPRHFVVYRPDNAADSPSPLTFILLMWRIGRASNSIPVYSYIQQDATLHSLFISGNRSTCFGWYFHPSSGAHTNISTASGICHTVTVICRYRGRVGTGLSVLFAHVFCL